MGERPTGVGVARWEVLGSSAQGEEAADLCGWGEGPEHFCGGRMGGYPGVGHRDPGNREGNVLSWAARQEGTRQAEDRAGERKNGRAGGPHLFPALSWPSEFCIACVSTHHCTPTLPLERRLIPG